MQTHIIQSIKLIGLGIFIANTSLLAQKTGMSYQIILETKGEYNHLNKKSMVNPDNRMQINDFTSTSQLYPIIKWNETYGEFETLLQVESAIKNQNFEKETTDFMFQELYTQFSYQNKHYFVLGKKRLDWGSGMIWNPTNFFIQKDPIRTQNRLEGLFMLNYTYLFRQHALSVYVFPEKDKKNGKVAIKYDYTKDRVDAGVSFLEHGKYQQIGYEITYGGNLFTIYTEGVLRNFSKNYKVRADGTLLPPTELKKKFRSELVGGFSINFTSNLSWRSEYRFREDYLDKQEIKNLIDHLPNHLVVWDPISIGKHTVFGSIDYRETYNRWSINLRSFYDPVSEQLIVSPLGTWSTNNLQIELSTLLHNRPLSVHNFQTTLLLSCFF